MASVCRLQSPLGDLSLRERVSFPQCLSSFLAWLRVPHPLSTRSRRPVVAPLTGRPTTAPLAVEGSSWTVEPGSTRLITSPCPSFLFYFHRCVAAVGRAGAGGARRFISITGHRRRYRVSPGRLEGGRRAADSFRRAAALFRVSGLRSLLRGSTAQSGSRERGSAGVGPPGPGVGSDCRWSGFGGGEVRCVSPALGLGRRPSQPRAAGGNGPNTVDAGGA